MLFSKQQQEKKTQSKGLVLLCNTFHLTILFIISFQMCRKVIAVYKMLIWGWREFKELWQTNQVSNLHFM